MSVPLDEFFAPLRTVVASDPIKVQGAWSASRRKSYATASQLGTGAGPFVEVVDSTWFGAFESAMPLAAIAFLCTASCTWWVKSLPAEVNPPVRISLTAAVARAGVQATFSGSFHGAGLTGVPVDGEQSACRLGLEDVEMGRPHVVAEIGGAAFAVLLLPGALLTVGRNRLWRLRPGVAWARAFPVELRDVLTRRRTGEVPAASRTNSERGR